MANSTATATTTTPRKPTAAASSAGPPVIQLLEKDKRALQILVDLLVQDHLQQFDKFRGDPTGFLNRKEWKYLDTKHKLAVFQAVDGLMSPGGPGVGARPSVCTVTNFHCFADDFLTSSTSMPAFIAKGTISGTVEDALYGLMTPTASAMEMRNQLFRDRISEGAVLATVVAPTENTPLTCSCVNWSVKSMPRPWKSWIKSRDFVYVDATGIKTISTGESIGFHVKHSIELPLFEDDNKKPDNLCSFWGASGMTSDSSNASASKMSTAGSTAESEFVRGKLSMCTLFRQVDKNVVQVFSKSIVDPMEQMGGLMAKLATRVAAATLTAYAYAPVCGQMKKLSFQMQQVHHNRRPDRQTRPGSARTTASDGERSHSRANTPHPRNDDDDEEQDIKPGTNSSFVSCWRCRKQVSMLHVIRECELCKKPACAKCSSRILLGVVSRRSQIQSMNLSHVPNDAVRFRKRTFCLHCLAQNAQQSTWQTARLEWQMLSSSLTSSSSLVTDSDDSSSSSSCSETCPPPPPGVQLLPSEDQALLTSRRRFETNQTVWHHSHKNPNEFDFDSPHVDLDPPSSTRTRAAPRSQPAAGHHQQQLYLEMARLCQTAQQIQQMTQQNVNNHQDQLLRSFSQRPQRRRSRNL